MVRVGEAASHAGISRFYLKGELRAFSWLVIGVACAVFWGIGRDGLTVSTKRPVDVDVVIGVQRDVLCSLCSWIAFLIEEVEAEINRIVRGCVLCFVNFINSRFRHWRCCLPGKKEAAQVEFRFVLDKVIVAFLATVQMVETVISTFWALHRFSSC